MWFLRPRVAEVAVISRFLSRRTLLADRFLYAPPEGLGLGAEDVEFRSKGGVTLRGWLLRGTKRGTVVFCPGNTGNLSSHLEYIRLVRRTGYSVLGFDYRGFGRSDGEPDLRTVVHDAEAACEFITVFRPEPYALFGLSLGAGAALAAAGRGGADAVAVVVEGTSDIRGMLRGLFAEGWFGPVRIRAVGGLTGSLAERRREPLVNLRLPSPIASRLANLCAARHPFEGKSPSALAARLGPTPVLLVHGVEDELLPFEAAIDLKETLPGPTRLWLVPETGHAQEPVLRCALEYAAQLEDFLDGAFAGALPPTPPVQVLNTASRPPMGGVTVRVGLDSSAAAAPARPVLLTAVGGGVLRQVLLDGRVEAELELPGPLERVFTLRVFHPEPDASAGRYVSGGYQPVLRAIVQAVNRRDLGRLDAALEAHMKLERAAQFDFVAALYCLRGAQAALGMVPSWPARDLVLARRSLERFLVLWGSDPALPGEKVAESPVRWVHEQLEKTKGPDGG
jgi:pimeloyl-ACP methyl ester carboxylesterase